MRTERPRMTLSDFFGCPTWTQDDEDAARCGAAIRQSFVSTAVRGTSRRRAKLAGGPKNRAKRQDLVRDAD